ncbi:MAG TPA: SHOCT domain-containing protein [Noviherbaspirillum sp.]
MKNQGKHRGLPAMSGLVAALGLAAGLAAGIPAHAAEGSRYVACPSCEPKNMVWAEGEFDQVHLVATTGGANLQPQSLSTEALGRILGELRFGTQRLFDDDSAATLAQGLSKALAKASPQQEAIFMVTSKPGGGLFGVKLGNSGRAFIDGKGLNLIFGEAHADFLVRYRATHMERPFDFGSRSKASQVVITGSGVQMPRPDWIVIPLAGSSATLAAPVQQAVSATVPTAIPVAAPLAAPAAPAANSVRDDQYYAAQEQRLKSLKRLRDQELINEQEYQEKRREILKSW